MNKLNRKIEASIIIATLLFVSATSVTIIAEQRNQHGFAIIWEKTFDIEDVDFAHSIDICPDGGFIIAGYSFDSGEQNDISFIKTDADGNAEEGWPKKIVQPSTDEWAFGVQSISGGGYALVGSKEQEIYLLATDENGVLDWDMRFAGYSGVDVGFDLQQTSDGGFIIAGRIGTSQNAQDIYVIKTNSTGFPEWEYTYNGEQSRNDRSYSVQQTSDGGYIITGEINFMGSLWKCVLIKLNSFGEEQWIKKFGTSGYYNTGESVIQTQDGGYIIGGNTRAYNPQNYLQAWLIKTDVNGNEIWNRTYGQNVWGKSVDVCSDGGYILTGYTTDWTKLYLLKTNAAGDVQAEEYITNGPRNYGYSVKEISPDNYIVVGHTGFYDSFDMWLFKASFGNEPPTQPQNPSPENGAEDVDINADLSWICTDPDGDDLTYDVYFGDEYPPSKVVSNQSDNSFDPGIMDYETTYYWQIIAWDEYGANTEGPIWDFTTRPITGINVLPSSYTIVHGTYESGGLSSLYYSDNSYLRVRESVGQYPPIWIRVKGTAPVSNPLDLKFTLESHTSPGTIEQKIELYNYVTQQYELVDTRMASSGDQIVEVVITSNPSRFINPTNLEMTAQNKYSPVLPLPIFPMRVWLDQTIWTLTC